ncbi:MAG: hypothetical protein AAF125_20150, partial [Chloroflexota bacterium]
DGVRPVALSSGGDTLLAATSRGVERIDTLSTESQMVHPATDVQSVATDGETRFAFARNDGGITMGTLTSPTQTTLTGHERTITTLAFTERGRLVSGSLDGTVRLWGADGTPLGEFRHDDWVLDTAVSPSGDVLAVAVRGQRLMLWDIRSQQQIGLPLRFSDEVVDLGYLSSGEVLVTTQNGGLLRIAGSLSQWKDIAASMQSEPD